MTDTKPLLAWSHSRIETFKKCPKQFQHFNILKDVPFEQSDAMLYGERCHKALELRLAVNEPLPTEFSKHEAIAAAIAAMPGQTFTEIKLTLNEKLTPTGYFAKDAYVRVVVDVMKLHPPFCFVGDWKTGKMSFDGEQLKLTAAVVMQTYPNVDTVASAYLWLKDGIPDIKTYTRGELPRMWDELLQEPKRLQEAVVMGHWPAKPAPGKCKWCTVNKYGKCADAAERYRG